MPFSKVTPDALSTGTCGVCASHGTTSKYLECKSLDSGCARLWICSNCFAIYNSTAEDREMDVLDWQKKWSQIDDFYSVPPPEEFEAALKNHGAVFDFFSADLERQFSGSYLEVGAGGGMMAAAAAKRFQVANVFDHVTDRLSQVKERVGDHYRIISADEIAALETDAVLIWHAMEHFLDPGAVFELCAKTLKPGGVFFIQVPVLSYEHVYPGHYYFYCERSFEVLAKNNNLSILKFYYDHAMNAMTVALQANTV